MDHDAASSQPATSPMDQQARSDPPGSTARPPDPPAASWASSTPPTRPPPTQMSPGFEFSSGPANLSTPSFDPAIAAFADMSFTRSPAAPEPYLSHQSGSLSASQPTRALARDIPDKKRVKMESETPALDSIDYWIHFDDDADRMGSFEINYSRHNDLANQNKISTSSMPGLGSGLYSTAMAPFREEDFIDDAAFDQILSDDEDMFEPTPVGEPLSEIKSLPTQPTSTQPAPLQTTTTTTTSPPPPPPPSGTTTTTTTTTTTFNQIPTRTTTTTSSSNTMPTTTADATSRQSLRDVWDALPHAGGPMLNLDEQRRLLEIALNSGQLPGTLMPPNGFGIGFGAGLGARPPQEFERRHPLSSAAEMDQQGTPTSNASSSIFADDGRDRADHKNQPPRRSHSAKVAAAKRPPGQAAETKTKSADRMAHNDVERKYRTNLKVKIAELRDAVPALHSATTEADSESGTPGARHGTPKVSKGTVLTKATEYIQQLEQRNRSIMTEHQQLARRLQDFETLFNNTARQPDMMMSNHSMTLFDPRGFC